MITRNTFIGADKMKLECIDSPIELKSQGDEEKSFNAEGSRGKIEIS